MLLLRQQIHGRRSHFWREPGQEIRKEKKACLPAARIPSGESLESISSLVTSPKMPACKGSADFDCDHGDLLYVYADVPGQPLKAIYFDNEGHVIHYDVSVPDPATAVFLSEASKPGPRFRLTYQLKGTVMSGKFQMQMPGQTDWKTYLEWSGPKQV